MLSLRSQWLLCLGQLPHYMDARGGRGLLGAKPFGNYWTSIRVDLGPTARGKGAVGGGERERGRMDPAPGERARGGRAFGLARQ